MRCDMNGVPARFAITLTFLGFTNYAWSDQPFVGDNAFLGDYEWCVACGGRVYGIWAEAAPEGSENGAEPKPAAKKRRRRRRRPAAATAAPADETVTTDPPAETE